jgi:radical SAM protein with 4Fe4S-binding SPASM domain
MKKYKRIYIEITNTCNLSCGFCPKTTRKPEFMSDELFADILKKIKNASEYLYFHVMGEPFMHPRLGYFLDLCGEYGYKVNLTTNATLIDKVYAILEKPALRQVNFSLHSSNEGKHEPDYMEKILECADALQRAGKLACLRLWNMKENEENPENSEIMQKITQRYKVRVDIEGRPVPVRGIKLDEKIYMNQANAFEWPDINREDIGDKCYCYGLREQIAILVDGTVVPCCLDSEGNMNLGNIKDSTLESIVNGVRAKAIYDGFSKKKAVEQLCKKCGYRTRFE